MDGDILEGKPWCGKVRFLVISDIHRSESVMYNVDEAFREHSPDAIIVCGDITHFGPIEWGVEFLNKLPDIPIFAVHGNCDPPEMPEAMERTKAKSLHGKRALFRSLVMTGFGGSNPTPFPTLTTHADKEYMEWLSSIDGSVDIVTTHSPGYGHVDIAGLGTHTGSRELSEALRKHRIPLALSGHIHEARGIEEDRNTTYVNPGKAADGFSAIVDMFPGEKKRPKAYLISTSSHQK